MMDSNEGQLRRRFLQMAGLSVATYAVGCKRREEADKAEVTPGEDLMQEHGVVDRILLVYEEVVHRIDRNQGIDVAIITSAAGIVRRFVQDYHERHEEEFVFPRLESVRREMDLVATLRRQHARGRELTDDILRRTATGKVDADLAHRLEGFVRMYRPHAAFEDTELFPAFRSTFGRDAYREMGERFEEREHKIIGEHGFDDTVREVERLEAALGIGSLASFTV